MKIYSNFAEQIEAYDGHYVRFVDRTHSPIKSANKNAPLCHHSTGQQMIVPPPTTFRPLIVHCETYRKFSECQKERCVDQDQSLYLKNNTVFFSRTRCILCNVMYSTMTRPLEDSERERNKFQEQPLAYVLQTRCS